MSNSNPWIPQSKIDPQPKALALRSREASLALGICERTLWELTRRGEIPHIRVGRAILYPVISLESWLAEKAKQTAGSSALAEKEGL